LSGAISQNEKDLDSAKALRADENKEYKASRKSMSETIDTLVRAASVLRKAGLAGSAGTSAQLKAMFTQMAGGLQAVMDAAALGAQLGGACPAAPGNSAILPG
jgi:hypothetical protein